MGLAALEKRVREGLLLCALREEEQQAESVREGTSQPAAPTPREPKGTSGRGREGEGFDPLKMASFLHEHIVLRSGMRCSCLLRPYLLVG